MPFGQPLQQPGAVPDMNNFDPTAYMSPMDLYDSIFWGMSSVQRTMQCLQLTR